MTPTPSDARLPVGPLRFLVTLHQPFLVGTGLSGDGLDDQPDPRTPLPASSLKGVMRDAAQHRLGINPALVDDVFGRPGRASAWGWSDALIRPDDITITRRSRNKVDARTGVAAREALATVGEVWLADSVEFQVSPLGLAARAEHRNVLLASAYAVTAVGMWRNRGMGTASIRPVPLLTREQAEDLAGWVSLNRGQDAE